MKKFSFSQYLRLAQLLVCGAIIGMYAAKALGFIGFDITHAIETMGAVGGAGVVALGKALHFV